MRYNPPGRLAPAMRASAAVRDGIGSGFGLFVGVTGRQAEEVLIGQADGLGVLLRAVDLRHVRLFDARILVGILQVRHGSPPAGASTVRGRGAVPPRLDRSTAQAYLPSPSA